MPNRVVSLDRFEKYRAANGIKILKRIKLRAMLVALREAERQGLITKIRKSA